MKMSEMDVATQKTMSQEDSNEEEADVHCCTKCNLQFTSLQTYVEHKLSHSKHGSSLSKTQAKLLQLLDQPASVQPRRRGRPPKHRKEGDLTKKDRHPAEKVKTSG